MIVRRPYAFLIKNFRLIHAVLFAMLLYLSVKTLNIFNFFSDYAANHFYINTANLLTDHINSIMYIFDIFAILISLLIYYILSIKRKSRSTYLWVFLYYIGLFIFFIYIASIFRNLQVESLDVESVRAVRDICLIVLLPQVVFLFIIFGRTLGFNLKQFDFKKDLEELNIDITDNEEVEVTLGNDTYKISRFFRKLLRLTKYFVLENKLFVTVLVSCVIFGVSLFAISRINIKIPQFTENGEVLANQLWYQAENSYITNTDMNNNVINEGKYYVLIEINVSNKYMSNLNLDRQTFRLQVNNELLIPRFDLGDKFMDLGTLFTPTSVNSGEDKKLLVAFEVDQKDVKSEYFLRISNYNENMISDSTYKDILIKPVDLTKTEDKGSLALPNEIDFKDTILKDSKLIINSYEIQDKFKENYEYCVNNNCQNSTMIVMPKSVNKGNLSVLKIIGTLNLDNSLYINKHIKTPSDLLKYYGFIRYRYMGKYNTIHLNKIDVDIAQDKNSYFEVPSELKDASKIELYLLIRGIKYTFILK